MRPNLDLTGRGGLDLGEECGRFGSVERLDAELAGAGRACGGGMLKVDSGTDTGAQTRPEHRMLDLG